MTHLQAVQRQEQQRMGDLPAIAARMSAKAKAVMCLLAVSNIVPLDKHVERKARGCLADRRSSARYLSRWLLATSASAV